LQALTESVKLFYSFRAGEDAANTPVSRVITTTIGNRLTVLLAGFAYLSRCRYAARSSHMPCGQGEPGARKQQTYDHLHAFPYFS
jgi:hypothetical protein